MLADILAAAARWQEQRAGIFADLARAHTIDSSLRPDRSLIYTSGSRGTLVALQPVRMPILPQDDALPPIPLNKLNEWYRRFGFAGPYMMTRKPKRR